MNFIEWNGRLVLHDGSLNDEHKALLRKANSVHAAVRDRLPQDEVLRQTDDFIADVIAHCEHEEREMYAAAYPAADQHRDNHLSFRQNLADLRARMEQNGPFSTLSDLTFALSWLATHINKADRAFDDFLFQKRLEARETPPAAPQA